MPYLDQASTSFPKPPEVSASISEYLTQFGVSPGRGNYFLAAKAHQWVEENVQVEPWQRFGASIACEPRCLASLVEGMQEEGLVVGPE